MRMYGDLASWWPLISPVGDYAEEAAYAVGLLESASIPVREVLELGSGGGHNAWHLASRFSMTLVDLSSGMLAVSRALNPDAVHVQGDMRTIRLGRRFDAVFVHDAIDYMTTPEDLRRVFDTAFAHCRPGGVAVFMPDHVTETYQPGTSHGGIDAPDGRGVRYLEWSWDPDPRDTEIVTAFAFLLRTPDGEVEAVHEVHHTGRFPIDTWLTLLTDAGFRPEQAVEETSEDRTPRRVFLGHRPG
jgi:hypothetical protein